MLTLETCNISLMIGRGKYKVTKITRDGRFRWILLTYHAFDSPLNLDIRLIRLVRKPTDIAMMFIDRADEFIRIP